jgi:hypothetical protein
MQQGPLGIGALPKPSALVWRSYAGFQYAYPNADGVERWYNHHVGGRGHSTGNFQPDHLIAAAFLSGRGGYADLFSVRVTSGSGAGGLFRFGLYTNLGKNKLYPDQLIFDSGDIARDSTGVKSYIPPRPILMLPNSLYWFALCASSVVGTGGLRLVGDAVALHGVTTDQLLNHANGFDSSYTYAALPQKYPGGVSPDPEGFMVAVRWSKVF